MALLFVTLPFVVRAVQPVLLELDQDMEEAAASLGAGPLTIFRRIILPNLTPAIFAGAALAFARAIGEFGSLVLLSGNIPSRPRSPRSSSSARSRAGNDGRGGGLGVLLAVSVCVLIAHQLSWAGGRAAMTQLEPVANKNIASGGRGTRSGLRTLALGYLACAADHPGGWMIVFQAFEHGAGDVPRRGDDARGPARLLADDPDGRDRGAARTRSSASPARCCWCATSSAARRSSTPLIDLPFAISPVVIGLSLFLLYGRSTAGSAAWLLENGIQIIFTPVGHGAGDDLRLAAVRRARGRARAARDRRRAGAGGPDAGRQRWQTFWRVTLPAIRWGVDLRGGAGHGARPGRVRRGRRSSPAGSSGETETVPLFVRQQFEVSSTSRAPTPPRWSWRCSPW